jgi:hypothetical protein
MLNESLFTAVMAELCCDLPVCTGGVIVAHCRNAVYAISLTEDQKFSVKATNWMGEAFMASSFHLEGAIDEARAQVLAAR